MHWRFGFLNSVYLFHLRFRILLFNVRRSKGNLCRHDLVHLLLPVDVNRNSQPKLIVGTESDFKYSYLKETCITRDDKTIEYVTSNRRHKFHDIIRVPDTSLVTIVEERFRKVPTSYKRVYINYRLKVS